MRPGGAGQNGGVDLDEVLAETVAALRAAGARFAYLIGSQAEGRATAGSDVDVAVYFGRNDVDPLEVAARLPGPVDLVVLDRAGLEIAGRTALHGRLLFDDDPPARVAWEAQTRKVALDERWRTEQARADFARGAQTRGRR
jgi:predicted nucleotidyltransferase